MLCVGLATGFPSLNHFFILHNPKAPLPDAEIFFGVPPPLWLEGSMPLLINFSTGKLVAQAVTF